MKLKDIANIANVSTTTVSLVLNNRSGVGKEKREYITKLLIENGYKINYQKPNDDKRSIRFLKYHRHSLLVEGNPGFVNQIIDAAEKESRVLGYNLIITSFEQKHIPEVMEMVSHDPLDGIIFLGTELEAADLEYLKKIDAPMVVVDNFLDYEDFNCVDMNNTHAIFSAIEHLVQLGHERIGFLFNSIPSRNCIARRDAYEHSVKYFKLKYDPSLIFSVHPTLSGAYESTLELLKTGVKFPGALVANNDSIALGALKAFKEYDLRIPEDISIVGFDGIPFSAISDPPLTTIGVSCRDIGIWTVRLLDDKINYPNSPITKIQIGTSLIVRGSTARYEKTK